MPGVMPIAVREDRLSDDGPGAMAPEVYAEDVAWTLGRSFASRDKLSTYAQQNADVVRREWSWTESTRRFLRSTGRLED